ncbi:ABC transporter substrate-binding protein [Paenibacillus sp. NPDC058071]|uniref:ABC transporter substrate-binding protein n=1 Tax=Paenibacillus sp. NPDC058071 TaxID=3346326 RepID=UPI0036DAD124
MQGMKNAHKRWRGLAALLLVAMLMVVAACGNGSGSNGGNGSNGQGQQPQQQEQSQQSAYPLTVKDDTGTEITFEQAPSKVVTLAPSETEVMYAIGAGEQVAGVDAFSNYPPEAASKPQIGDMTTNIEAVVALTPDLVLASSSMNAEAVTKLRELKIAVYATDPTTYDATADKITTIGRIVGKEKEAETVAQHMKDVKQQVQDAVKDAAKKPVYLEFSPGWTVGSGTFLNELLTIAGGTNISAAQPGWFEVSAEEVVKQNPQLIIYPDLKEDPNPIAAAFAQRPGWDAIDAIKNKQLFAVAEDPLVRVGPRLADGLLELAKTIHPDLFS